MRPTRLPFAATCARQRAGRAAGRRRRQGSKVEAPDAGTSAERALRRAELLPRLVPVARTAQARLAGRRPELEPGPRSAELLPRRGLPVHLGPTARAPGLAAPRVLPPLAPPLRHL